MKDPLEKRITYEVLVADNGSTDGSAAMVKADFPRVRLFENTANRGFAAANNQLIWPSQGRYILLLNPDTIILDDALPQLVAFMDAHPQAAVATAQLLNPDGTLQHCAFRFPTLWMVFFDFFPLHHRLLHSRLNGRYPLEASVPYEIDHPLGACLVVRREAVHRVGLLDEAFFMYAEEVDWCFRFKKAGWRIYCLPQAHLVHYGGQSTQQRSHQMFVELHRSRFHLFRKHYSGLFRWAARWIVRLGVAWEGARIRRRYHQGRLDRKDRDAWLRTYKQVARMR